MQDHPSYPPPYRAGTPAARATRALHAELKEALAAIADPRTPIEGGAHDTPPYPMGDIWLTYRGQRLFVHVQSAENLG